MKFKSANQILIWALAASVALCPSMAHPAVAPVSELEQPQASRAAASLKSLGPAWAKSSKSLSREQVKSPNASLLSNRKHGLDNKTLVDAIWDEKQTNEVEQNFHDSNREYEMRSQYGLATQEEDRGFMNRMKSFGNWVMTSLFKRQVEKGLEDSQKNSSSVRGIVSAQKSLERVVKPSLSVGSTEQSQFQFKMGTKADIPGQKGSIWMRSDLVDGSVEVQVGNPWSFDPSSLKSASEKDNESYRLSLSRGLPLWDLKTSLTYGGSTTIMTTAVSKELSENLRVQFANRRGANLGKSNLPGSGENVVELLYGLKF